MVDKDNGPASAYPGPIDPHAPQEEGYPDIDGQAGSADDTDRNDIADDPDLPLNPPVDEAEEPSPGSSA